MNNALKFKSGTADNTLAGQVYTALTALTGNSLFVTIALFVATMQDNYDAFMAAKSTSLYGGRAAKTIKNTAKKAMVTSGNEVVVEVNRLAKGNRDILAESGLVLGAETITPVVLHALKSFKIWNGINLGDIFARAVKGKGAKSVLIEYAIANTLAEVTAWVACPDTKFTCKISGFTSQSRVWFRTTSVGTRDQKIMSTPISIVVL